LSIDPAQLALYSVDPFSPTPFSVGFDPIVAQTAPKLAGASLGEVQLAQQVAAASGVREPSMSLLGDIVKLAAPIVGGYFGGPVGATIGAGIAGNLGSSAPGSGAIASMAALPAIGGAVVGTTVRAGIAGARTVIASARYYCAKYPGWCISIGGLGAVQGMVQNGQLPVHRRRRARGITAGEFRGFRKVHKVLSGFCAPKMRIRKGRR
jgi:hypothetical protein